MSTSYDHLLSLVGEHLCFNISEKGHLIVPDWYKKILGNKENNVKTVFFNEISMKIWFNMV